LDFILPRSKKPSLKLIAKIKQKEIPLIGGRYAKCSYDAMCALGKLFECEIQVMKKI